MTSHNEYATALFMLAEEMGKSEKILSELETISAVLAENPSYADLLDTPAVSKAEKLSLIDEAFSSLDEVVLNFFKILCERRIVRALDGIKREFSSLYDDARGILRVMAVSAVPLTAEQLSAIAEKLSKKTGKRAIVENSISPEILGGVKLRYSGIQLDSSLRTRLDKLEEKLRDAVI